MIVESSAIRYVIQDEDGDELHIHHSDGGDQVISTQTNAGSWASVVLTQTEVAGLISRLQGHGTKCPSCLSGPGYGPGGDICKSCLGSGTFQPKYYRPE